jgi:hypothetical protein
LTFEEKFRIRKGKDKTYHLWFLIRKAGKYLKKRLVQRGGVGICDL